MLKLQAHSSNLEDKFNVFADFEMTPVSVVIHFEVEKDPLVISKEFNDEGWDNWGLWEFDVVEVFISSHENPQRYLELQCSPLNQKFALDIYKPRETFEKISELNSHAKATITPKGFSARFEILKSEIPGELKHIKANFCASLHADNKNYYYAANINPEAKADFHRPELFINLEDLNG